MPALYSSLHYVHQQLDSLPTMQGLKTSDVLSKSDPFAVVKTGHPDDRGKISYT